MAWHTTKRLNEYVFRISEPLGVIEPRVNVSTANMYVIVGSERCALVDSGMGVGDVREEIAKITSLPCIVLNTHHHWDHVGANALFDESAIHKCEAEALAQEQEIGIFRNAFRSEGALTVLPPSFDLGSYRVVPGPATRILHDGDQIDLGGRVLKVLHTPGHSPGHCTYMDEEANLLFTGDTAYEGPVFACFEGSDPAHFASSAARLAGLPGSWIVCPGHNDPVAEPGWLSKFAACVEEATSGRAEGIWRDDLFVGREVGFGALSVWLPE